MDVERTSDKRSLEQMKAVTWRRIAGILVLVCMWGALLGCQKKEEVKKDIFVPVEIGVVKRGDIKESLLFTGDIEGQAMVQVYSTIPARIQKMNIEEGSEVKKGEILAVVKYTTLVQRLAQAQAQLASVQSNLAGAQVGYAGAVVSRASAKREYLRLKRLLKGGAVGKQQVDMARAQYDGAINRVEAAKAQSRALRAQVRALRAGVAQARSARYDAMIRAPISGIIANRARQVGDMAMPQFPLMTIVQMDKLKVRIQLTEQEMSKVTIGKRTELKVAAHPGRLFSGIVKKIAPTLSMDTRTVAVEIHLDNLFPFTPEKACQKDEDCQESVRGHCLKKRKRAGICVDRHPLKPGMIANVQIFIKTYEDITLIPEEAVLNSSYDAKGNQGDRREVLVLTSEGVPLKRKIRVGIKSKDGKLQVLSGLKPGEKIIVNGHNLYRPGVKIKIINNAPEVPKKAKPTRQTN